MTIGYEGPGEITGRIQAWRSATKTQGQALLRDLFSEYPLAITQQTFHLRHASVDFETIWRSPVGERAMFQDLCRTKFVKPAYRTWEHRVIESKPHLACNILRLPLRRVG